MTFEMILGMGNYKMSEFWKFSVPMYIIRILALSLGAILIFPMKIYDCYCNYDNGFNCDGSHLL